MIVFAEWTPVVKQHIPILQNGSQDYSLATFMITQYKEIIVFHNTNIKVLKDQVSESEQCTLGT